METKETSVGAFIYKIEKEEILFLLVYSERNKEWGFPKGHVEPDETELETAKREIKEETGIENIEFVKNFRCTDTYKIKGTLSTTKNRIIDKNVIYYLARTREDFKCSCDNEIGQGKWLNCDRAIEHLKHDNQKKLLKSAYMFIKEGKNESCIK
ncbi:MAG: NUDIX domain-containing protein [Elusimicrobia bacterium]|nr:NUDIX domain-containing protein [Elusimicrobiota bacterium]